MVHVCMCVLEIGDGFASPHFGRFPVRHATNMQASVPKLVYLGSHRQQSPDRMKIEGGTTCDKRLQVVCKSSTGEVYHRSLRRSAVVTCTGMLNRLCNDPKMR